MKALLKIFLVLFVAFTAMLVLFNTTGLISREKIEVWIEAARGASPLYAGITITFLLFCDLFMAMPTMTVTMLSGYFIGHGYGAFFALLGMFLASTAGYFLSRKYGERILRFLVRDEAQRLEAIQTFQNHGVIFIILARAVPLMPEATACLSGMTKMSYAKFILAWLCSAVPYVFLASYAGSISSFENPRPAIFIGLGISATMGLAWFLFHKMSQRKASL